jgi:hypothetical protein
LRAGLIAGVQAATECADNRVDASVQVTYAETSVEASVQAIEPMAHASVQVKSDWSWGVEYETELEEACHGMRMQLETAHEELETLKRKQEGLAVRPISVPVACQTEENSPAEQSDSVCIEGEHAVAWPSSDTRGFSSMVWQQCVDEGAKAELYPSVGKQYSSKLPNATTAAPSTIFTFGGEKATSRPTWVPFPEAKSAAPCTVFKFGDDFVEEVSPTVRDDIAIITEAGKRLGFAYERGYYESKSREELKKIEARFKKVLCDELQRIESRSRGSKRNANPTEHQEIESWFGRDKTSWLEREGWSRSK